MAIEVLIVGFTGTGSSIEIFKGEIDNSILGDWIERCRMNNPSCVRIVVDIAFPNI